MALINCSECGKQISSNAKSCPNCGNPSISIDKSPNTKSLNKGKQRKVICKKCKKDVFIIDPQETKTLCPHCGATVIIKKSSGSLFAGFFTCMKIVIAIIFIVAIISALTNGQNKKQTSIHDKSPNSTINPKLTPVNNINNTKSKTSTVDTDPLQEDISIARQKMSTVPDYDIFSMKGTANITLNDKNISIDDLVYISSVYARLYTQNNKIEKLFINYFFPDMNDNESSLAVAIWEIEKPDKFSLSGAITDYSNTEYDLNKIKFNGWSSDNKISAIKSKPKTTEEEYNTIKNTPAFKAYADFIDEIYSDKLYDNNPFADTSGDKELFEQLKPKYTQIVNKKYNINFDIDKFENKYPNHKKLLQYHRKIENNIRNAYLKEQYETLKGNQLFHAYIVEYPKLVSSQLPEIDNEIERQLGKSPTDPTKNKKYVEEYQKLDKYLWGQARINCAKQISKKYNFKFNINEIEQQNPEWKDISTWYAGEQYKLNEEAKKQALEEFDKQFSGWDGSNRYVEKAIKSALNDPSSYEHHQTFRNINENSDNKKFHVITRFRAKNGFGALMMNRAECDVDLNGNISNLEIQPGF